GRMLERDKAGSIVAQYVRNSDEARMTLFEFWQKADSESRVLAWRLFRRTGRNPLGRYWSSEATTYVDMSLYGGHDIADAARSLPDVLVHFDRQRDGFAAYYRQTGMLGDFLVADASVRGPSATAKTVAEHA